MFVLSKRTAKIKLAAFTGVVQKKDWKVYLYPWLYNFGKIFTRFLHLEVENR